MRIFGAPGAVCMLLHPARQPASNCLQQVSKGMCADDAYLPTELLELPCIIYHHHSVLKGWANHICESARPPLAVGLRHIFCDHSRGFAQPYFRLLAAVYDLSAKYLDSSPACNELQLWPETPSPALKVGKDLSGITYVGEASMTPR